MLTAQNAFVSDGVSVNGCVGRNNQMFVLHMYTHCQYASCPQQAALVSIGYGYSLHHSQTNTTKAQ